MNVSKTVRMVVVTAVAALSAACGDSPLSPTTASPAETAAPNHILSLLDGVSVSVSAGTTTTLTIDPTQSRSYSFGNHWVYIPAGAVCADGGYGPQVWDADCTPATTPTSMSVTYTDGATPSVKFSKDVRFRPAAGRVYLGMKVQGNLNNLLKYTILYTPTGSVLPVDESKADASLRAFRYSGNTIVRRLKHFSGYNVALGIFEESCPDSMMDGMCDVGGNFQ